jgi:hypothetical protein
VSEIIHVLNKVLVKEFYRLNTGFFLLVITLAFGFMSGVEHKALAMFFISSPIVFMIPITIWSIYALKIINFDRQHFAREENEFLYNLNLLPTPRLLRSLSLCFVSQFLPAIFYGGFLFMMAVANQQWFSLIWILSSLSILICFGTSVLFFQINHPNQDKKVSKLKKFLDARFTKSIQQFYIEWLIRKEPLMLIGTKLFSCLLIYAVCALYKGETYDWRLLAMGTTLSFCANMILIHHLHRFENFHFVGIKNLPITLLRRFLTFVFVFVILCLPEAGVMLKNFPVAVASGYYVYLLIFGISIGVFFYSTAYLPNAHLENFTRSIFMLVILWIVFILFKIPLWILIGINFGGGYYVFTKNYYNYELPSMDSRDNSSL